MKSRWLALSFLLVPVVAFAAGPHVQSSLMLAGTITVNADGSVRGYTLYKQDDLEPYVVQVVKKTIATWQFQPIIQGGKAVPAETGMMLRIVAEKLDDEHMTVKVASEQFGCNAWLSKQLKLLSDACPNGANVTWEDRRTPRYPGEAVRNRVGGEVYVTLQINREGRVTRSAVRQVNLYSLTPRQGHFRSVLGRAVLDVVRHWRYQVPTVGPEAAAEHWTVTVPVKFTLSGDAAHRNAYGSWNAYVPGPKQEIPWAAHDQPKGDAIAGDGAFLRDSRFVLKAPPGNDAGKS